MVKYGKIYNNNKRKTNYNIAIIYQTSNTNTKRRDKSPFDSVDKSRKKLMTECDNGTSSKKTKNFQI